MSGNINLPEKDDKSKDDKSKDDKSKDDKSLWNDKLAELVLKSLLGGGAGTLFTLIGTSDLPKLALGAGIGGAATMAYAFVEPIVKRTNKGLGQAGESTANALESTAQAIGNATGQAFAKLTSAESRYFEAQAQECQHCRRHSPSFCRMRYGYRLTHSTEELLLQWRGRQSLQPDIPRTILGTRKSSRTSCIRASEANQLVQRSQIC